MSGMRWGSSIVIDGKETTLHQWLKESYLRFSDAEIAEKLVGMGQPATRNAVRSKRRREGWKKQQGVASVGGGYQPDKLATVTDADIAPARVLNAIRNKPRTLRELSRQFDRSEDTIQRILEQLETQHFNIIQRGEETVLDTKSVKHAQGNDFPRTLADEMGMRFKIGIVSDSHAASTAQQITNLNKFIGIAYEAGVRHVLHSGDVVAGEKVYRGQIHDLFAHGADAQLSVVCDTLPVRDGLVWYMIGGNHDYSFVKGAGYNIVAALADRRDDVVYLGYDMADVPLTDRVDARLWHPSGGVPYALSYRLQKGLEQIGFDELLKAIHTQENPKMRIVSSGHLHVRMTMGRGPITGFQAGCFEGQTNYLKRKALFPDIGGYIVEIWVTDGGLIQRIRHEWIAFLEIEDDYLNYPELLALGHGDETPDVEPVFEWVPSEEEERGCEAGR